MPNLDQGDISGMFGQHTGSIQKKIVPVKLPNEDKITKERITQLESMEAERLFKRGTVVSASEDVRTITSTIEENNNNILKLMNINAMLSEARANYVKEVEDKFDEENPSHDVELKGLADKLNPFASMQQIQWEKITSPTVVNTPGYTGGYGDFLTRTGTGITYQDNLTSLMQAQIDAQCSIAKAQAKAEMYEKLTNKKL